MIRVNMVQEIGTKIVRDKNGITRKLNLFVKDDNLYIGPVQALFDRTFILRDRHRMDFNSKLDKHQNEMPHVSFILDKIEKFPNHSYFTKGAILDVIIESGVRSIELKPRTYIACKELFIQFGFNSMNFCLDRRGDIWVHYKSYEEQKQRRDILKNLSDDLYKEFDSLYNKSFRFIRYVHIEDDGEVKCFALKSLNISKIYRWLTDKMLIHKVNYISEIYNEAVRELEFYKEKPEDGDDMYYKIYSDKDGLRLKETCRAY